MKIMILDSEKKFDLYVAWKIIGQILKKPDSLIGLATGKTTHGIHVMISAIYKNFPFDTSKVSFYGLDEVVMVPDDFPRTCASTLRDELIKPLNISCQRLIMPAVHSDNYTQESMKFEKKIFSIGCDLQIVGIGPDGHIGMNLPGASFDSDTRLTPLSGELDERIRKQNHYPCDAPLAGITLGIRTIMRLPKLILAAKGQAKADIIKKTLQGPITEDVPATVLQLHPHCEVVLDAEAASGLL
jgi:glucosamine-6-phosphate deaminase